LEPVALTTRCCNISNATVSARENTITPMLIHGAPTGSGCFSRSIACKEISTALPPMNNA
jgi:hypothetical protein